MSGVVGPCIFSSTYWAKGDCRALLVLLIRFHGQYTVVEDIAVRSWQCLVILLALVVSCSPLFLTAVLTKFCLSSLPPPLPPPPPFPLAAPFEE